MVGIPAMNKVAREIAGWPEQLGEETAAQCLRQVREYLSSPPDLEGDRLTAGRHLYIRFLEEAQAAAGLDLAEAIGMLHGSMEMIPDLSNAIREERLENAGSQFRAIAELEEDAYSWLREAAG
jgi:hypothetical protein